MPSTLRTPICARYGIDVPIFGFAHSVAAAGAISRAGGVGIYGATRDTPEEIRARLKELRALAAVVHGSGSGRITPAPDWGHAMRT
jgi:NAD(P)H-dependent flavin oxidoreductase YrpB (nitropropane dioxygenase family)